MLSSEVSQWLLEFLGRKQKYQVAMISCALSTVVRRITETLRCPRLNLHGKQAVP